MGAPDVVAAMRREEHTATEAPLRILFLHPKTLVDSWPVPVDTLGEIVKFPSATYPVLAAAIRDLSVEIRMLDGYVGRIPFRDYKTELAWADLIAIRACRLSRRWTPACVE
jgi:anaerobic magnesium-protoporphyrin IX monomethyl ester cyclase